MTGSESTPLFLGLDLSTQQLKAIVVDDECSVRNRTAVNFASELPQFRTENGICRHEDGMTVTSPVQMWLKAIDLCLMKLSKAVDMSRIRSVCGCGQQHGTVYWDCNAEKCLVNLSQSTANDLADTLKCSPKTLGSSESMARGELIDFKKCFVAVQITNSPIALLVQSAKNAFAKQDSPIWMDSSTTKECELLENAVGGPMALAQITGSRAFHRFSGNQILKIIRNEEQVYASTERISLVSSFVASVLCGHIVGIDAGDACGMNLMDVRNGVWSEKCLNVLAETDEQKVLLKKKLGDIIPCESVVGKISSYFCDRYGFLKDCEIVAFTGDNLSSMAGLCLQRGEVAISLGTSDTVLVSVSQYTPALEGHIFRNPVDLNAFMGMLCFKNGSFTRDRIRRAIGASDWESFAEILSKTPPGNNGNIGFYFDDNEIVPNVSRGDYRFDSNGAKIDKFDRDTEARAVLEHQCLTKRLHAGNIGYDITHRNCIYLTGGASSNRHIAQILADVFNCDVFIREGAADSAALGGALRARHCSELHRGEDFFAISKKATSSSKRIAQPNADNVKIYDQMLPIYARLEKEITSASCIS